MKSNPLEWTLLLLLAVTVQLDAQQQTTNTAGATTPLPANIQTGAPEKFPTEKAKQPVIQEFSDDQIITGTKIPTWDETTAEEIKSADKRIGKKAQTNRALIIISPQAKEAGNYKLRTTDGQVYEVMSWDGRGPDSLSITYIVRGPIGGIYHSSIPCDLLPDNIFEKFHFDVEKVNAYRQAKAQADKEYRIYDLEYQKNRIAQETADALSEQAVQQKKAADAAAIQATAAMIQATNPPLPPVINIIQQQWQQQQQQGH